LASTNSHQPATNRMEEEGLREMFRKVTISLDWAYKRQGMAI
jgi:hypothetical protein